MSDDMVYYNYHLPVDLTQWQDSIVVSANIYVLCILGLVLVGVICIGIGLYRKKQR